MKKKALISLIIILLLMALVACDTSQESFSVKFIVDGKVVHTINTNGKEKVDLPTEIPQKEGYIFTGWVISKDSQEEPFTADSLLHIKLFEDKEVFAKWEKERQYTITFDSNGGTPISSITSTAGRDLILPNNPTRVGYTFSGWFDQSLRNEYDFTVMPDDNMIFYAKWDIKTYTVTFDLNGGTLISGEIIQLVEHGESAIAPECEKGGGTLSWDKSLYNITEDITIVAIWHLDNTFMISFNSNGGNRITPILQESGTDIQEPDDPIREGHTFIGWFDKSLEEEYEFTVMPAESITLYAKWEINTYIITFNLNGGTLISGDITQEVEYKQSAIAPVLEKEGYILSWDKGFENITEDTIIEAIWIQDIPYTISFNSNGGNEVSAITQSYGTEIIKPDDPLKEGYVFDGWFIDDETFLIRFIFTTMPGMDIDLIARWTSLYYREGDCIFFGMYPQTIKADDISISSVLDEEGYYVGSDGERYTKIVATPDPYAIRDLKFSTNEVIEANEEYYFKVEPIKWRILKETEDMVLLLCDIIIDSGCYASNNNNNYIDSEIRAWLNEEFYTTAFHELQQELINITLVDNSEYSTGNEDNPNACEDTNDKIFLPSYQEMTNANYGFSDDESGFNAKIRLTSDYSRATGAYIATSSSYYGRGTWWLRSPFMDRDDCVRFVNTDGYIVEDGGAMYLNSFTNRTDQGIVPALIIQLN